MANHSSAEKRHRQSLKRRDRNRKVRALCHTAVKKASAAEAGAAADMLKTAEKALASAAAKGVLHKKAAARKISRLVKAAARKKA